MYRRLALTALGLYWLFCITAYSRLPQRIPSHFDAAGRPDAWTENIFFAWFGLPALATVTIIFVYAVTRLAERSPRFWNIPQKKKFMALTPERRAPIVSRMIELMDVVALYTVSVMAVAQYSIYTSASGESSGLSVWFHIIMWGGLLFVLIQSLGFMLRIGRMIEAASAASDERENGSLDSDVT